MMNRLPSPPTCRVLLASSLAGALAACSSSAGQPAPDLGLGDAGVTYMGPTMGSNAIPDMGPPSTAAQPDAGMFPAEPCCYFGFSIPDSAVQATSWETPQTTGAVRGTFGALQTGLPLTLENGTWTATACLPLSSTIAYWYEFSTPVEADAGTGDAGAPNEADGGLADGGADAGLNEIVVDLCNPEAPDADIGLGHDVNLYGPYTSCEAADASMGTL